MFLVDVVTSIQCRDILTCFTNKVALSECRDITDFDVATLDVMVSSIQALVDVTTLF